MAKAQGLPPRRDNSPLRKTNRWPPNYAGAGRERRALRERGRAARVPSHTAAPGRKASHGLSSARATMATFEDVRMTRLRQAMGKTLDGAIGGVSLDDFLSCFPDLVQTHEGILHELYTQLTATVRANVMVRTPPPPPRRSRARPRLASPAPAEHKGRMLQRSSRGLSIYTAPHLRAARSLDARVRALARSAHSKSLRRSARRRTW